MTSVCKRIGFVAWLLTVLLGGACSRGPSPSGTAAGAAPPKAVPVEAIPVSVRSAQRVLEVTGTLQAFDKVTLSAEVDGPVQRVLVDLGDRVTPGQLLAEINPAEFQIQVAQVSARLRAARAGLGLKEGEDPHSIRTEDTPEVRRAQANLEDSQQNFRRVSELFKEKIGTEQAVDQARATLRSAQANLAIMQESIETQRAQIEQFLAELSMAQKKLRDTSIKALLGGSISERHVSVGQYVKAQTPLFTLVQLNPLRLRAELSERMAPVVRANQTVQVRVDGLGTRTFPATISRISPAMNEQSRSLLVEALVRNDDEMLRPGMFARASIQSHETVRALMLPAKAVLNLYGVTKVFTVTDGVAQDRTVRVGDRYDDFFEILDGVKEQELVAVSNLERLTSGVPVEVKKGAQP
jgi:RND family efflux transporter MFP subunit